MKNYIKIVLSILTTLLLFFGPSYLCKPDAFNEYPLWVVITAAIIIFLSQPPLEKKDLKNPDDKHSMLGIMVMAIVVTNLTCLDFCFSSQTHFNLNGINIAGFVMIFGGIGFRIYSMKKLSFFFSNVVHLKQDHMLIDKDIYSVIRHPSYTGAIISIAGNIVWLESWKTSVFSLLLICLAYYYRIKQEEKLLTEHFGDQYLTYRSKTGALLPRFKIISNTRAKNVIKI